MSRNKVIIDLRTASLLGPFCKFFEILTDLKSKKYHVVLIDKDWSALSKQKDNLLWDPNKHPRDIINNLVLPTFSNIEYQDSKRYTLFDKLRILIPPYFSLRRIVSIDFGAYFMSELEKKRFHRQYVDRLLERINLRNLLIYSNFALYFFVFRHYKLKLKSIGFRYKLSNELCTSNVSSFIEKHKSENVKYILISVLWDESMKFEVKDDRLKGGPLFEESEFDSLLKYVDELDKYALKTGKIKFILASKKAVDWQFFLKSSFVDLRDFEKLGFTMSQMIYIAQELSSATINWPSTFSIWITNCSQITHLTWMDNKDTANWARNELHLKPIKNLLDKIEVF